MRVLGQEHRSQSLANSLNYYGNYHLNVIPEESVYLTIDEGSGTKGKGYKVRGTCVNVGKTRVKGYF